MKELFCVAGSTRQMRNVASALAAISIDHNLESESFDHSLKWYKTTKRMWCHSHCTFPLILLANTLYKRSIFKKRCVDKKDTRGRQTYTKRICIYLYLRYSFHCWYMLLYDKVIIEALTYLQSILMNKQGTWVI